MPVYIHYNDDLFDVNKFDKIVNESNFTKPRGGFWASRVDAEYGWKDWCKDENFRINREKYIKFELKEGSRVLKIDNIKKLKRLPMIPSKYKDANQYFENLPEKYDGSLMILCECKQIYLDFEKLSEEYDAVELVISDDYRLYYALYTWDCDSILIMNPNIVAQQK